MSIDYVLSVNHVHMYNNVVEERGVFSVFVVMRAWESLTAESQTLIPHYIALVLINKEFVRVKVTILTDCCL